MENKIRMLLCYSFVIMPNGHSLYNAVFTDIHINLLLFAYILNKIYK